MGKSCRKCAPKANPRPLFYFGKTTQRIHYMQQILLKLRHFERRLSKTFKKLTVCFLSNWEPFNGQRNQKQKGPGTNGLSLFRLRNKFTKMYLLVTYYLTKFDGVMQIGFWVIPNITPWNLWKPIHDIIIYSFSFVLLNLESGNEQERLQKYEYLEHKKNFLDEIKNIFHSFWRAITWWKNKI